MGFKNKDFQNFFFIRPTSKVRLFLIHGWLKFFISRLQEKVFFNEISSVHENYVLSLSKKKVVKLKISICHFDKKMRTPSFIASAKK